MPYRTAWALALTLCCAGCVARYVRIQQKGMTCVEAQHIAIDAVRRMGYTISETTKADPTTPGLIVANRYDGTTKRSMMVSVFCTTQGAEVEAKSEGGGLADVTFSTDFRRSFDTTAAQAAPPRTPAESGVDVLLTPGHSPALAGLGIDWGTMGLLPVGVRITNHTERAYRFETRRVELRTATGEHATPLTLTDIKPPLSPESALRLRQMLMEDRDIAPRETATGVLMFPFNAYTRARVELIDRMSEESEGFAIEF